MWFTDNECTGNDFKYFILTFVVYTTIAYMQMRQVLGESEIDNLALLLAILGSGGVIFVIYYGIIKIYTNGCFGINEWWLVISVIVAMSFFVINLLAYVTASVLSAIPWFFLYPALTVRADGRKAAEATAIASVVMLMIGLISYLIITNSWWWFIDYFLAYGPIMWWFTLYQYNIIGIMLMSVFGLIITLLPIGIGGYYLPGYWSWRYRETMMITIIVLAIDIILITYGGLLTTVINMGFGRYVVSISGIYNP